MSGWLHILGIGESGLASLTPASLSVLEASEFVIGGDRHPELPITGQRLAWPKAFGDLLALIDSHSADKLAILTVGDPLWYSIGARLARALPDADIVFHPQLSALQFVACRMGWSMGDVELLTLFGRDIEQIVPAMQPGAKIIAIGQNGQTPIDLGQMLLDRNMGESRITAFWHLGGDKEGCQTALAKDWQTTVPDFLALAIECRLDPRTSWLPRTPGLPNSAFLGQDIPCPEIRAATLAKLAPRRGAMLWDIGCGSGPVAIEWMRVAPEARAIGIEPNARARQLAAQNALRLGAPKLLLVTEDKGLHELALPDAVVFNDNLNDATFEAAWTALQPPGRLVANIRTPEALAFAHARQAQIGGKISRLQVELDDGRRETVWQWSLEKN